LVAASVPGIRNAEAALGEDLGAVSGGSRSGRRRHNHQDDYRAGHEPLERGVIGQAGKLRVRGLLRIDEDADAVPGLVTCMCMVAASTSYEADAGPVPAATAEGFARLNPAA